MAVFRLGAGGMRKQEHQEKQAATQKHSSRHENEELKQNGANLRNR